MTETNRLAKVCRAAVKDFCAADVTYRAVVHARLDSLFATMSNPFYQGPSRAPGFAQAVAARKTKANALLSATGTFAQHIHGRCGVFQADYVDQRVSGAVTRLLAQEGFAND